MSSSNSVDPFNRSGHSSHPDSPRLTWSRLRSILDFTTEDTKAQKHAGVYIWGFQINSRFIPWYVGEANNLNERAFQHNASLRGGAYSIYHSSSLETFMNEKGGVPKPDADSGLLYVPTGLHALATQFLHPNVQSQVAILVHSFRITFGVPDGQCDLDTVERSLADHFDRRYLQSSISSSDTSARPYDPRDYHHNSDGIVCRLFQEDSRDADKRIRIST